jgi:ABC-type transport system involved in cytochrome c biogenesis ATPase subunit
MRLRYLHIRHYPPLEDVELAPGPPALPERACAIRFVVGVNGSGKTHLLQAVTETFLALARQRPPHFPITLIYELGEGERNRLLIFKGRGPGREPRWWQSTRPAQEIACKDDSTVFGLRDWQALLTTVKEDKDNWQPLFQQGNWPGEGVGLPQVVLAYTTGCIDPWQTLFRSEPAAGDVDIVSQSEEYETTERPAGWSRERELDFLSTRPDDESRAQHQTLQRLAEENRAKVQEQQLCHLLDPVLLKFALLAVSLRQAMADYRTYASEASADAFMQQICDGTKDGEGLRRLLNQVGWAWPVSVVFELDFNPDAWGEREAMQKSSLLQALYSIANEAVREPDPSTRRRLFFDLKSKSEFDPEVVLHQSAMEQYFGGATAFEFTGDALLQFLGGKESSPFDHFKTLLDLRRQGLLSDIQIALRKADLDDILLFDELSDGEQVYLGRMALFHLLQGESDALLLLDEPEVHFNDKWKREIVDIIDEALKERANDVLIATHSSITLTDVFNDEIILFKKHDGEAKPVELRSTTFGSDPSEVMVRLFDVPDSMGKRALEWLDSQLDREWTHNQLIELEELIGRIGPGYHRSELRGILRRLKERDSAAQD